jgi:hypothetical protein
VKPGEGGRAGRIGSLLLGQHGPAGLEFAGHVGTGFSAATLGGAGTLLAPLRRDAPPFATAVPREHARHAVWDEPVVVVEVEYTEWTRDGAAAAPVVQGGLRDDVPAEQVVRRHGEGQRADVAGPRSRWTSRGRQVVLSNLDKVLYPGPSGSPRGRCSTTTRASRRCCCRTSPGRALTRKRYPDGVEGQVFFEKNAPRGTPSGCGTVTLPTPGSSKGRETIDFVVVDDLATLVWTANLASLELHTHMWRVDREPRPRRLRPRPRPAGDDRRVLPGGRPAAPAARGRRARAVRQDLRQQGPAALRPRRRLTSSEQTSAYAKGLAQRLEQGAARPRRAPDDQGAARRQGARRLVAEQRGQDDGVGLQPARPRAADRLDARDLGRGGGVRRPVGPRLHQRRRPGARRAERRPVRPAAGRSRRDLRRAPAHRPPPPVRFHVQQRVTPFQNSYRVLADDGGRPARSSPSRSRSAWRSRSSSRCSATRAAARRCSRSPRTAGSTSARP